MLHELHVAGLGVIDDSIVTFGPGLTALTGETGAGKTLLVDALALVLGGRPQRGLVPAERTAIIEARFSDRHGTLVELAREIPADGRARAWIDGHPTTVAGLAEVAGGLCDIHGQHDHQTLLAPGTFRSALDAFGRIDLGALEHARSARRALEAEQRSLGGDPTAVDREIALLEHQERELATAGLSDATELDRLLDEARVLASGTELIAALSRAREALERDEGPRDEIATLRHVLEEIGVLEDLVVTLRTSESMLDELSSQIRASTESIHVDPARLDEVNERLRVLHDLCRRYGPSLDDVIDRHRTIRLELTSLTEAAGARASLEERRRSVLAELAAAEQSVEEQRQRFAPIMAERLRERLATLALERATVIIDVTGPAGDETQLLFSANPSLPVAPVGRVASGGELARLMLAIRLILPGGPPTMVFDEVDAGIGGSTAVTLAGALHGVAADRQVLVVTHLAQVAARADQQISVVKANDASGLALAAVLDKESRVVEIARMLSGDPCDETALRHAAELLERSKFTTDPRHVV